MALTPTIEAEQIARAYAQRFRKFADSGRTLEEVLLQAITEGQLCLNSRFVHWPDDDSPAKRGTGRTTRAILGAPMKAVFICWTGGIPYVRDLAARVGRNDLHVIEPAGIKNLLGVRVDAVVVDHAAKLTVKQALEAKDLAMRFASAAAAA